MRIALGSANLNISTLDSAWSSGRAKASVPDLALDLSESRYFDVEGAMLLLSLIVARSKDNLATQIKLPTSKSVLDFLRSMGFAQAVEQATGGVGLDTFLETTSSEVFVNRAPVDSEMTPKARSAREGVQALLSPWYFPMLPIDMGLSPDAAASVAKSPWLSGHLTNLLGDILEKDGRRVGNYVVQEAVKNAVAHPFANYGFTAAQIRSRELVLSVWDDGVSFAESLGAAQQEGSSLRSPVFGTDRDSIGVRFIDYDGILRPRDMKFPGTHPDSEEALLAFAWLLGATSTPSQLSVVPESTIDDLPPNVIDVPAMFALPNTSTAEKGEDGLLMYSGVGLALIRRCVIDLFGGTIQYASGGYRFQLRGDSEASSGGLPAQARRYKGTLTYRRENRAQVGGNLLVFRIPLKKPVATR